MDRPSVLVRGSSPKWGKDGFYQVPDHWGSFSPEHLIKGQQLHFLLVDLDPWYTDFHFTCPVVRVVRFAVLPFCRSCGPRGPFFPVLPFCRFARRTTRGPRTTQNGPRTTQSGPRDQPRGVPNTQFLPKIGLVWGACTANSRPLSSRNANFQLPKGNPGSHH